MIREVVKQSAPLKSTLLSRLTKEFAYAALGVTGSSACKFF